MRVGSRRRVYATPTEGDGPTARYDIEVVGVMEGGESSAEDGIIASLGGRRAATRLLFALSFVPYFLPEQYKPALFESKKDQRDKLTGIDDVAVEARVDPADKYVSSQLDALFAQEERPLGKRAAK